MAAPSDPEALADEIKKITRPFTVCVLAWGFLGFLIVFLLSDPTILTSALGWYLALFVLSVFDLLAIAGLSRVLLGGAQNKWQAVIWGVAKVGCLGLFGLALWKARTAPTASVLTGLATLIVVPLVGSMMINTQKSKLKG